MKNIFSLSFKCEIVKILHRAFRLQNSILAISKRSPLHHALNVGFAKRAFNFIAKAMRLSSGKNEFNPKTPIFSNGGLEICAIISGLLSDFFCFKIV